MSGGDEMETKRTTKIITVEEHEAQLAPDDIAEILDDLTDAAVTPDDITICVLLSDEKGAFGADEILAAARAQNKDIPKDAELILTLRWKREVESVATPVGNAHKVISAQDGFHCRTCGALPAVYGPTPDCHDAEGCGKVRQEKGEVAIPTIAPAAMGNGVHVPGNNAPLPPNIAVNRETGERAFLSKDGSLYGKHDDYTR
jgi:hypothetical protein